MVSVQNAPPKDQVRALIAQKKGQLASLKRVSHLPHLRRLRTELHMLKLVEKAAK